MHRRRPVRHLLGSEDRQAHRHQLERLGRRSNDFGRAQDQRVREDAGGGNPFSDRAGLRGRVGKLHKKFGRLSWAEIFRPAIYYADEGFPVTEIIQGHWRLSTSKLAGDEGARRLFLRDAMAPAVGECSAIETWRKPSG